MHVKHTGGATSTRSTLHHVVDVTNQFFLDEIEKYIYEVLSGVTTLFENVLQVLSTRNMPCPMHLQDIHKYIGRTISNRWHTQYKSQRQCLMHSSCLACVVATVYAATFRLYTCRFLDVSIAGVERTYYKNILR